MEHSVDSVGSVEHSVDGVDVEHPIDHSEHIPPLEPPAQRISLPVKELITDVPDHNYLQRIPKRELTDEEYLHSRLVNKKFMSEATWSPMVLSHETVESNTSTSTPSTITNSTTTIHPMNLSASSGTSPLTQWLFNPGLGLLPSRMDLLEPYSFLLSPVKDFSQMSSPPSFEQNMLVTEHKRQEMLLEIPELEDFAEFSLAAIDRYNQIYWEKFHFQYPILHQPSFQVDLTPTPLFLSIILIGASYLQTSQEFRSAIANPLRWLIFKSPSFHPPTRVWILQSLLLLEIYEKTRSESRFDHERAHIHHGTTIQLIRRGSTLLDPSIDYSSEKSSTWMEWVEAESIKRAVFLAFVLDVTHSVIFSHAQLLHPNELQLSLPCDDRIWDSSEDNRELLNNPTVSFMDGLRSMLKGKHIEANCELGRLALLYGLLSQYLQISNLHFEASSLDSDLIAPFREKYSDILSNAIDFWWKDYEGEADGTSLSSDPTSGSDSSTGAITHRQLNKFDYLQQYHYVYISMRIRRFELHVFCGDRRILGKTTLHEDYLIAEKYVYDWARKPVGKESAFHALQVLLSTFLNYGQPTMYSGIKDPYIHRPAIISHCALVYWAYCFCLDGPESTILSRQKSGSSFGNSFQDLKEHEWALAAESGLGYLERCKSISVPDDLDKLENKNRTVGLLKWVILAMNNSEWPMLMEFCQMMDDCVKRSLGWEEVVENKYNEG